MTNFSISYSFVWVFVCIAIGVVYSWLQYTKSAPWSKSINITLAIIRSLLVTFICFLLLEPFLRTITNYFEKPLMVVAVDNSESMVNNRSVYSDKDMLSQVGRVQKVLQDKGFQTEIIDINANEIEQLDSIKFSARSTNLSQLLSKIKLNYNNYNVSGLVLFSDGIYNEGYSPLAIPNIPPVYSIGFGDTSSIKDLSIKEVLHNSTVYEGNKLQLEVQVLNNRMGSVSTHIHVYNKSIEVASQRIEFTDNQKLLKSIFYIPITGSGKQSLRIVATPVDGEYTDQNNSTTVYFDVINARKRILILASAPNPDIKAIKTSLENNEYYDVQLAYKLPDKLDYQLIILHNYPDNYTSAAEKEKLTETKIPKWFIVSNASDFNYLISQAQLIKNRPVMGKADQVRPLWNPDFKAFSLNDSFIEWVSDLPPITTPYSLTLNLPEKETLLSQQIGNVKLDIPLLCFTQSSGQRTGLLLGNGIWRWKLDEFRKEQSERNFNDLILRTVQYLSSDVSKRRFFVHTDKNTYDQGEGVRFLTEEYNAVFERITGNKVRLSIKDETGNSTNYSYVPLSENSTYTISNLKEGVYSYRASTRIDSVSFNSSGQFVIRKLNLESLNPVADFNLLRKLSDKSSGRFYTAEMISDLMSQIDSFNPVSTIHSSEANKPLNTIKWVLILLLVLATGEWFLRKFFGGY